MLKEQFGSSSDLMPKDPFNKAIKELKKAREQYQKIDNLIGQLARS